jgi:hypothetical protein
MHPRFWEQGNIQRNRAWFLITTATYNLIRITTLDASTA